MDRGKKYARRFGGIALAFVIIAGGAALVFGHQTGMPDPTPHAQATAATNAADVPDAMTRFQTERSALRAQEMAQLSDIQNNPQSDPTIRELAARKAIEMTKYMEQEGTIEGVLRMRGFEQVVCTVHEASVNILIRGNPLTRAQSAIVMELALRETGQQSGHIKIIPVA